MRESLDSINLEIFTSDIEEIGPQYILLGLMFIKILMSAKTKGIQTVGKIWNTNCTLREVEIVIYKLYTFVILWGFFYFTHKRRNRETPDWQQL